MQSSTQLNAAVLSLSISPKRLTFYQQLWPQGLRQQTHCYGQMTYLSHALGLLSLPLSFNWLSTITSKEMLHKRDLTSKVKGQRWRWLANELKATRRAIKNKPYAGQKMKKAIWVTLRKKEPKRNYDHKNYRPTAVMRSCVNLMCQLWHQDDRGFQAVN